VIRGSLECIMGLVVYIAVLASAAKGVVPMKAAHGAQNISNSLKDSCGHEFRWDCIFCWCGCGSTSSCPSKSGCRATGTGCGNNACWCNLSLCHRLPLHHPLHAHQFIFPASGHQLDTATCRRSIVLSTAGHTRAHGKSEVNGHHL